MRQVFAVLIVGLTGSLATGAEYWDQFRGPQGNGSAATALPIKWSETENIAWKTAIDGKAWSSPVVWGDEIWLTNATTDGKRLSAVCVDGESGKIVQDITVFEIAEPMYCIDYNSYASPTPVIEEGRLWVHYGSAGTACLDTAAGKVLWSRQDFPCDHHRGPGSSPIVFRDLVYLNFDGIDVQYVVALNKSTGETVWKKDRAIEYGTDNGDFKKAYSTPTVLEHAGRWQLVSSASVGTESYNPLTGEVFWTVYHGGFNAAARPLYSHGKVVINLQGGLCLLAVRPDGSGDVTKSHIVWDTKQSTPTRPSQLIVGDHLYMVNDKGIISCVDLDTGTATWTERMGSPHSASPIAAEGRIYTVAEDGQMRVVAADPKAFRLLAENQLDEGCMASPAVIDNDLLIRTKTHLYRISR
ncbi:MAG TPA: PQQ-binding-like beta-propeller repeat protein [Pirellulaceae bacterium]|nr:PQQ-binding-like beta-propeller repeat protein [Pirellulaceae bacterium]